MQDENSLSLENASAVVGVAEQKKIVAMSFMSS
jgi:hypothetical protein